MPLAGLAALDSVGVSEFEASELVGLGSLSSGMGSSDIGCAKSELDPDCSF
jgi:hypothetical protein